MSLRGLIGSGTLMVKGDIFSEIQSSISALESLSFIMDSLVAAEEYEESTQMVVVSCILSNPLLSSYKGDTLEVSLEGIWGIVKKLVMTIYEKLALGIEHYAANANDIIGELKTLVVTVGNLDNSRKPFQKEISFSGASIAVFESFWITGNTKRINLKTFLAEVVENPMESKAGKQLKQYAELTTWILKYKDADSKEVVDFDVLSPSKLLDVTKEALKTITEDDKAVRGYDTDNLEIDEKKIADYAKRYPDIKESQIRKNLMERVRDISWFLNDYLKVSIKLHKDTVKIISASLDAYSLGDK